MNQWFDQQYKVGITLLLIFCRLIIAAQSDIDFKDISLQDAFVLSAKTNKPVMLMCHTEWCTHCNNMKQNILRDKTLTDYFNKNFICVSKDMEKGDGISIRNKYVVNSFPSFMFFDTKGTMLYRITGEFTAAAMIEEAKNAFIPAKQWPTLKKRCEANIQTADSCVEYVNVLRKSSVNCADIAHKYFTATKAENWLSEPGWRMAANCIWDVSDPIFAFIVAHQREYAALTSPQRVERKIYFTVKEFFDPVINGSDSIKFYSNHSFATGTGLHKVDSLLFIYEMQLKEQSKNWNQLFELFKLHVKAYTWKEASLLNRWALLCLQHSTDKAALLTAAEATMQAAKLTPETSRYLLAARLFQKAGEKNRALQQAQTARQYAIQHNQPGNEADAMIEVLSH